MPIPNESQISICKIVICYNSVEYDFPKIGGKYV